MKRVAIVQARLNSDRLPNKVLLDLAGRPMIAQQMLRLKACSLVDEIVVATTTNPRDDAIVSLCRSEAVRWFRGSENDVLERHIGAARDSQADVLVRITADCPLIDPQETDRVIAELVEHSNEYDYASNSIQRTFPRGLDTEAMFFDTLERASRLTHSLPAREHVTLFIYRERPDLFLLRSVVDREDNSDLRWTVDMPEDLTMVRRLYEELGLGEQILPYRDILSYVRSDPSIPAINAHIQQRKV